MDRCAIERPTKRRRKRQKETRASRKEEEEEEEEEELAARKKKKKKKMQNLVEDALRAVHAYWMSIPMPDAVRVVLVVLVVRTVVLAGLRRLGFATNANDTNEDAFDKGLVVECDSLEQVEKELKKAKRRNKAVTIDYGATWCPPCRRMKPIYAKMSREFRDACAFLAVDVDKARDASTAAKIQCMPTFHFYAKDGEKIEEEVQGLDVGKLRRILTKDLGCEARAEEEEEIVATPGPGTVKDLQEKKRE